MSDLQPEIDNSVPQQMPEKIKPESDDSITISRTMLNYAIVAITFLLLGIVIGTFSLDDFVGNQGNQPAATTPNTVDSETIETAVRTVLEDAGLVQPLQDMDSLVDDDPYLGEEDAPIVIVEFSAYTCPYCGRHFEETFQPILENHGEHIRYVFRDFPAVSPSIAYPAAVAANCALEQDKFWEYHEELFANQEQLGNTLFVRIAEDLELDMEQFNTCYEDQTYLDEVQADFDEGIAVGVSGTPSFYINGKFHSGARPYSYFERIIERELEKAGIDS